MTDEELAAIEDEAGTGSHTPPSDVLALVAEVRRLRALRLTMHVMREGIVEASLDDKYHNLRLTVRDP